MTSTLPKTLLRAWAKAIPNTPAHPETPTEFGATPLTVVEGKILEGLRGTLFRNGPARLARGGMSMGHWFDGDGAILKVQFTESGATGAYRFVQTAGYREEAESDRLIFGNYGMVPPGNLWERFTHQVKNVANTSVLALPDQLLALWEGGFPYALNPDTLETIGSENLGTLQGTQTYSAHPKVDPQTGEIFNFGVAVSTGAHLHLYRSDRTGKIQQTNAIPLNGIPLIHDFVMAGPYLVVCVSPVRMRIFPAALRLASFSDSLEWQPKQGTQILVFDRQTLELVSHGDTDPWFQWHYSNGFVDGDGNVVIDVVRYADFKTNQRLKEVATGQMKTAAPGTLWQLRLDPQSAEVISMQQISDRACEFPIVHPHHVGQDTPYTYVAAHRDGSNLREDMYSAIARINTQTGDETLLDCGENVYPSEPIYAPDQTNPDQGWLVSVVFDGDRDTSEVWVIDAANLAAGPVCRLALPSIIPLSFHGTWQPAHS